MSRTHIASFDVFERWSWLYAICREQLFTDHTSTIATLMREQGCRSEGPLFFELGCGPGFYSRRLAGLFPHWHLVGVDRSNRLIARARRRTEAKQIANCRFLLADVTHLEQTNVADFVLASRLLLILNERGRVLDVIFNTLKPGGWLLIIEPLAGWRTALALGGMRMLHKLSWSQDTRGLRYATGSVGFAELNGLLEQTPWSEIRRWSDGHYHFALCRRGSAMEQGSNRSSLRPSNHTGDTYIAAG